MDQVNRLRALFNKAAEERAASSKAGGLKAPTKLSVNDFVIKASSLTCADVPEVNLSWQENFVRQLSHYISVAVATPTGLITPIVTNIGSQGLGSISAETKALATKAKKNQLTPPEYQGGTFTVSNLGMFGSVSHFTAIINSPQSCILAVGGAKKKLAIYQDPAGKGFKEVEVMKVTLSCDHRVVDRAVGARWQVLILTQII
ncbi:pyruvate dehydrogenase complex dihydrolipoamide acetyltransferase component (E2) [Puccinia graminis f. sp. tritici]|uniref:Pyruvate dehydrogenase complex dihydrolipoamide acetyltransferase component (E2) n=1 Tax=Puccinia graminis f. sp. tritici TaxID=56615 RepID=A0A5B0MNT7_PUCGR|nr:pyruvate dehydrogenase complex dihydrolipoamide acetyltransferase component (E2) [Puccinia graminis f. sp. tritici]